MLREEEGVNISVRECAFTQKETGETAGPWLVRDAVASWLNGQCTGRHINEMRSHNAYT